MSRLPFVLISVVFTIIVIGVTPRHVLADQPRTFRFEIPAGSLDQALAVLERASGISVTAPAQTTLTGLPSPGMSSTCTVDQALGQLLAGSGLTFRLIGANHYTLEVAPLVERIEVSASRPDDSESSMAAMRTLTPLREVPQAVTVITQRIMADQLMTGVGDVSRYVPGIGMAQGEGNRDTPVLRGNATTGDFFVDGLRDDVQYYRDLYNVERVEVLKGPNAMIFGRGGAGGVINRATRQADWGTAQEIAVQAGSFNTRRATLDLAQPVNSALALRMTGMYENSGSYRDAVDLNRYGLNPTIAVAAGGSTLVRFGYEHFHDRRTADRGIPSFAGRPFATDDSTFFGDPALSEARATVDAITATVDRTLARGVLVRNRTRYATYDKFYQNVYPSGAVAADGSTVPIGAYNNATTRQNLFNQTDVTFTVNQGRVRHVVLAGAELGRQVTDNLRNTGYFSLEGRSVTTLPVPTTLPTVSAPVTFRPSASDADNHGVANVIALYAQDQLHLWRGIQVVGGLRYDRFEVEFRNNRTSAQLSSADDLISPRAGLIYSLAPTLSFYTSYSLAYVPRAGDQLSSLSLTNQTLDPEKFTNYEVGAKWDAGRDLALTAAVYRLNRSNVAVSDPADATRLVLVDGQRTEGIELGISGHLAPAWQILGAYTYQDGKITRAIAPNAPAGATLAQLPAHSFSIWNRYDFAPSWGAGLGIIHNGDKFTSTDNTVILPAFTRVDGALFLRLSRQVRAQMNVENLLDRRYYASSNGNNNIAPGAPRSLRLSVTTRF